MRRRRQRDAIKASALVDKQLQAEADVLNMRRMDVQQHTKSHSIVTLGDLGLELGTQTGETTQTFLVTDPVHCTSSPPSVLSTSPTSISPASVKPSSTILAAARPDASSRCFQAMRPQSYQLGRCCWSMTPCASIRIDGCGVSGANMNPTALKAQPGISSLLVSSPCSPQTNQEPATPSALAPAAIERSHPGFHGQLTVDTLRLLLGSSTLPSGTEIEATLQAAVPEVYED